MKRISIILSIAILAAVATSTTANAQLYKKTYFNVDWQFNGLMNDFANTPSGWGMSVEGGYYVAPKIALGVYASFHTNNEYIGEGLLHLTPQSDLYTDQAHSLFQVPFGALFKYRFVEDSMFEPYVTAKLGATFSRTSSVTQVLTFFDEQWGFNAQPEIGVSIFPSASNRIGIHLGIYYSYSTNRSKVLIYDVNGLNNLGFHVGLSF